MQKKISRVLRGLFFMLMTLSLVGCGAKSKEEAFSQREQSLSSESQTNKTEIATNREEELPEKEESQKQEDKLTQVERLAQNELESLTLEEKVGQLFLARCPEEGAIDEIKRFKPAGYILFGRDFKDKTREEVKSKISSYQAASEIPMLIGVDEEGGVVVRISSNPNLAESRFKSPQELESLGGLETIRKDTLKKSELLQSLGINLNLAPVADISINKSDYIHNRTFGKGAEETAQYVQTVVGAMKESGLSGTLKHFPGYGNNVDTHTEIAIDKRSIEEFREKDFIPFKKGIESGVESILVSHNRVIALDDSLPSSLSPRIHEILRNELGFKGVIMTDDLIMEAIKQFTGEESAVVLALKAGNDLMIVSGLEQSYNEILTAIEKKAISEKQVDEAVLKVLKWKITSGIIPIQITATCEPPKI